jgi:hypothetical protein
LKVKSEGRKKIKMVPKARLELAWVAPHGPQPCVSTNSTTSAPFLKTLIISVGEGRYQGVKESEELKVKS